MPHNDPYVLEPFRSPISPSSSQDMRNAPGADSDLWHRNIAERSICTQKRRVEAECSNVVGLIGLADIPIASPALAALVAILSAAACARSAGSSSCGGEDSREGPLLLEKAHLVMLPAQLPATVGAPAQLDTLSTSLQRSFYVVYCIPPRASSAQPTANWLTMLKADHAMA